MTPEQLAHDRFSDDGCPNLPDEDDEEDALAWLLNALLVEAGVDIVPIRVNTKKEVV
jgi:hypothetical protein